MIMLSALMQKKQKTCKKTDVSRGIETMKQREVLEIKNNVPKIKKVFDGLSVE